MSQAAYLDSFGPTIPIHTPKPPRVEEAGSVSMLLKSPKNFAQLIAQDRFDLRGSMILAATAVGFYALYGLAMGGFAGGNSLWQAMLKTPMILVGSVLLCAPGLYMLRCLTGAALSFRQTAALLAGLACATSVIMVAFAPVAWLFGISTTNVQFMVILHSAIWGVSLGCGLRLLAMAMPDGQRDSKALMVWAGIFLLVSAQMLTYFQPILGVSPSGAFRDGRKQFFFEHLYASMLGKTGEASPAGVTTQHPIQKSPVPGETPVQGSAPRPMSN